MWDLPRPGLEPVSPALAGGFLTTAPPGKSSAITLIVISVYGMSFLFSWLLFKDYLGFSAFDYDVPQCDLCMYPACVCVCACVRVCVCMCMRWFGGVERNTRCGWTKIKRKARRVLQFCYITVHTMQDHSGEALGLVTRKKARQELWARALIVVSPGMNGWGRVRLANLNISVSSGA